MLKQRIGILVEYLNNTHASLNDIVVQRRNNTRNNSTQDDEDNNDDINQMKKENNTNSSVEEQGIVTNVIDALKDLEYLLSDVDMARDFHTLGGWAPLVSLLDINVHAVVADTERQPQ
jgi:dGTP triphosphohydrolase